MTESHASKERFDDRLRELEAVRDEIGRRQRVTLMALLPLAAAMALIIPYMQIVITLQEADYYYILERPHWPTYLRLAGAALFAGPVSVLLIYVVFKQLDEFTPTFVKMMVVGVAYGIIMPFVTGILTPLNLFIIGITGVSNVTGQGSAAQMLGDWVFSTPLFTFLFGAKWLGPGIMFGLVLAAVMWWIARLAGPIEDPRRARFIYAGSVLASVGILLIVTAGPFGLFSYMFEMFL